MKLSDYLKSIDNLDEKMEKAVIIAGYEKMFGEHYRLPQEQFADLMELPFHALPPPKSPYNRLLIIIVCASARFVNQGLPEYGGFALSDNCQSVLWSDCR